MSDTTFNGDARSVHVLSTPANSTTESTTESLSEHKQSENQRQNHFQIRHFVFAVRFGRIFGNFCNDRPQIKFRPTLKSFKCAFATNFGHENASHLAGSLSEFAWSLFWSDRHTIRATEAVVGFKRFHTTLWLYDTVSYQKLGGKFAFHWIAFWKGPDLVHPSSENFCARFNREPQRLKTFESKLRRKKLASIRFHF